MTTLKLTSIWLTITSIALVCAAALMVAQPAAPSPTDSQSGSQEMSAINPNGKTPSDEEIRARSAELLANQHKNDDALEFYERVERQIDRTGGANPHTIEDRTYRIVPTGAGNQKIVLSDEGKRTDPATYKLQMQALAEALQAMADPNDPKTKAAYAKREKRQHERAEFVDATKDAYNVKWLGTATVRSRLCNVFELDPNPNFHPHSMFQAALEHVTAKIWVDRETDQLAHGEAQVTSDVSFGAGILGKLYRGGVVSMDQAEVAPGIWLPTRYQYDFSGRKFLFSFEQHQLIEASHYRRVGPPKDTLLLVRTELSSGKPYIEDP
jgi:hypothetical protein